MRVFVTGAAGFIGFHLCRSLLEADHEVTGYDAITPYYDARLKWARLALLGAHEQFDFVHAALEDEVVLAEALQRSRAEIVVHLAAQAGVRHGLEAPAAYVSSNLIGTFNLLEGVSRHKPKHFLLASTSSVYGGNLDMPFAERDGTDYPASLYAATKRAGEAMSHAYAHLHAIPTTCFRFFTVYGTWGRPDMALYRFVAAIEAGQPIELFGEGRMSRDATYVGDLVEAISRLMTCIPKQGAPVGPMDSLSPIAPWRVVNIASGQPVALLDFVAEVEAAVGRPAVRRLLPMQPGEVAATAADPSLLEALIGVVPTSRPENYVREFVAWYRDWRNPS